MMCQQFRLALGDVLKLAFNRFDDTRVKRTSVSGSYHAKIGAGDWQTTLAWGRNSKSGGGESRDLDGWLLESTWEIDSKHTVFGRAERGLAGRVIEFQGRFQF